MSQIPDHPGPTVRRPECAICQLHGRDVHPCDLEIARSPHWLLRHHPAPAPLPGWLLLDARRHIGGPIAFNSAEAATWGHAVQMGSDLVQQLTGCDRVYAIAFGEGAPHLHLHLIPRFAGDSASNAWCVADLYRDVMAGDRSPARVDAVLNLVDRARLLVRAPFLSAVTPQSRPAQQLDRVRSRPPTMSSTLALLASRNPERLNQDLQRRLGQLQVPEYKPDTLSSEPLDPDISDADSTDQDTMHPDAMPVDLDIDLLIDRLHELVDPPTNPRI